MELVEKMVAQEAAVAAVRGAFLAFDAQLVVAVASARMVSPVPFGYAEIAEAHMCRLKEAFAAARTAWALMAGRPALALETSEEDTKWVNQYSGCVNCDVAPAPRPTVKLSLRSSRDCFCSYPPSGKPDWPVPRGRRWTTCTRSLLGCFVAKMRSPEYQGGRENQKTGKGTFWSGGNFGLILLNQGI